MTFAQSASQKPAEAPLTLRVLAAVAHALHAARHRRHARQGAGDINQRMAEGIDESACVLVFVTRRYIDKAGGYGPNGADDNVKFEFDYALRR